MAVFVLTCRQADVPVLNKLPIQLNFLKAPQKTAEQGPSLPSLDLVPKLSAPQTVLLMGVDSNGVNADHFSGTRSDTMMLVSIDPLQNKVGVVSIPRDTRVQVPKHGLDKINSAHALGGPELSMQTIRDSFGVPVDHYIEVDTSGLKKLFEILGPVQVLVEKEMHYVDHAGKLNVDLKPGLQTLSPAQTEEYLRFRHDAKGDIGRIERQQWFVRQAARKLKEPEIVLKLPQLICLAYQCVRTDLSVQDLMSIAAFAKDFPHEKVVTSMLPGEGQMISGGSYWVVDALAAQHTFSRILGCSSSIDRETKEASLAGSDAASAAEPAALELSLPEDSLPPSAPGLSARCDSAPSVSIKYPKGCEQLSQAISEQLSKAGFRVRYRYQIAESDCKHELLIQQSASANEENTNRLFQAIPETENFPVSLAIESHPATDFTLIVSRESQLPSICHKINAPRIQDKVPPLSLSAGVHPVLPQE